MTTTTLSILPEQIDALLTGETNQVANLANAAALLNQSLEDINWVGFYLYDPATDNLDLGPFQGNVACMHIQNNQGVCGTAFYNNAPLRVANVHEFKGHIACDSASNSELVIPINVNGKAIGVLDIDSPLLDRFSATDEQVLSMFVTKLAKHLAS
ncbi:GAF domain-containing protein [Agrilactobacillus composti DSM 18527 = JCM 14202]|uniref:GAF domain-containing protein n=1 Tax=Agrilactobacillus composti DSM 18527 = JCM 14202 TaxID=1423734 RepID=X0PFM7_9LACO|nr:GAF domain-containing protein [Agrilactobacillus composti]KRM36674.1 GAF domain-containing protein [Agrilactobacillus composti DSM 18527 = JCM 14202]GAF40568.1 GAF domain protein [Agrilactobacillus composti DSM 18527 = JCM 14202]